MLKKFQTVFYLFIFIIVFIYSFSKPSLVSQKYIVPINQKNISSEFGYRHLFNKLNFHDGIDFPATVNTKVYATNSRCYFICKFYKKWLWKCSNYIT